MSGAECIHCSGTGTICMCCDQAIDECRCFADAEPNLCARCSGSGKSQSELDCTESFSGTYKGGAIDINREPDGRFYITVRWKDGCYLYDGWAPEDVATMQEAKREAIRGAGLSKTVPSSRSPSLHREPLPEPDPLNPKARER